MKKMTHPVSPVAGVVAIGLTIEVLHNMNGGSSIIRAMDALSEGLAHPCRFSGWVLETRDAEVVRSSWRAIAGNLSGRSDGPLTAEWT